MTGFMRQGLCTIGSTSRIGEDHFESLTKFLEIDATVIVLIQRSHDFKHLPDKKERGRGRKMKKRRPQRDTVRQYQGNSRRHSFIHSFTNKQTSMQVNK